MLYQYDVEVVDDGLAGKENNRLESFAKRNRDSAQTEGCNSRAGERGKIGNNYCDYARKDRAFHPQADPNELRATGLLRSHRI